MASVSEARPARAPDAAARTSGSPQPGEPGPGSPGPQADPGSSAARIADDRLLASARAGDVEAFGRLVRRHQDRVYRIALRMLGSTAEAEDAAQETFVHAWRGLHRFRGDAAVSTWLYRIVTNRCLNVLQRGRRTVPWPDEFPADAVGGAGEDPAQAAERHARFAAVTGAVARLPAEQRAALVLRDFEGLSYEEISHALSISVAAVKGRIHRGRLAVLQETSAWR